MKRGVREQILEEHHREVEREDLIGVFNVDIEGTMNQVRFYTRQSSRSDTKPRRETFKKNRMINGVKSSRQVKKSETSNLLKTHSLNEVVMNRQKSSLSRMTFDVSRLERIEQTVIRQVISETKFNNSFSEFRQERQVRNGTII